jgi:hypothetical protein
MAMGVYWRGLLTRMEKSASRLPTTKLSAVEMWASPFILIVLSVGNTSIQMETRSISRLHSDVTNV